MGVYPRESPFKIGFQLLITFESTAHFFFLASDMLVFAKKYFFNKMRIFFIGEISPKLAIFLLFRPTSNDKYRQCRRNVEEFSAEFEFLDFGICREKDQDI